MISFETIEILLIVRIEQEDCAPYIVSRGWYDSRETPLADYPFPSPSPNVSDPAGPFSPGSKRDACLPAI